MAKQIKEHPQVASKADRKKDRHKTRHHCNAYGCPSEFRDHWKLMMHMFSKHRELLSECELIQHGERTKPKEECEQCGKVLQKYFMKKHLKVCKGKKRPGSQPRQ